MITSRLRSFLTLCLPSFGIALSAQTAPAAKPVAETEEVLTLSPFTINADKETGWVATESLSGSRMKTQIKDLAQPLEVMTLDFMQDLGVNSFEQALVYSTNIEGRNELTSGDGLGFGVFQPRNNTRARGLFGSTLSRNFFEAGMPTDNYNLDRITIARGPNSILFGLGSPSGIVDVSLQRANLRRQFTRIELQADSEESRRSAFNSNVPVVAGRLALRIAGMSEEQVTDAKPNLDRQDRYYGVLTAQPFRHTTLSLHGEKVNRMSNRTPRILPVDGYSLWLNANQVPGSRYGTGSPLFDNRVTGAVNPGNTASPTTNVTLTNVSAQSPIFNRQGNPGVMLYGAGALNGSFASWNNAVEVREPQNQLVGFNPLNSFDRFSFNPVNPVVALDENTFGTSRAQQLRSDLVNLFLEQRLAPNLFLEVAFNKEDLDERTADSGFGANTIKVDANQYLPGTTTPNPNVGRYYIQGRATGSEFWEDREDWRATLSYEFDFAARFEQSWLRRLGRHRLAGLVSGSESTRRGHQLQRGLLDNQTVTGVTLPTGSVGATTGTGTANWATNAARDFHTRYYLGGESGNAAYHPFGDLFGTWQLRDSANQPMNAYLFDSPYTNAQGWKLVRTGSGPEGSLVSADTRMLAWQGYFARDRVVLLYGYREDEGRSASIDPAYQVRDFSGLYPSAEVARVGGFGTPQTGITRTYGAVWHLFRWASASYNQSDTFQLNIGRFDPFGNEYPGAQGEAKDIGLGLRFFDERLILRANYYTNTGGPTRAGNQGFNDPIRDQMWNIEENLRLLDPAMPTLNVGSGGFREKGRANYWVMFDAESKGYELDLTYRPNRNWSVLLNAAKNDSVESNIGIEWMAWLNARLPVWQTLSVPEGGKANPRDVNGDGSIGTWTWATAPWDRNNPTTAKTFKAYYDEDIVAQSLAFIQAVDGRGRDQGRKYRANLVADYTVTEGRLRGIGATLAFRYRSAPNLGYGVTQLPSGLLAFDLDKPIEGADELITDLGLRYRSRTKRFGGVDYRVQLNVRNLLDDTDLVPVKALTTGEFVSFSRVEPRVYQLTLTFEL
jgi:iron complex outermembrane recepter protein